MIFPSWLGFCLLFCILFVSCISSSHQSHCIGTLLPSLFSNLHPFGFRRFSPLSVRSPVTLARARGTSEILFLSGIKMFSEWVATCRAVLL